MSDFLTEKETESLLETETRDLPLHDGTTRPHTTFKTVWRSVDSLIDTGTKLDELVEAAIEESELQMKPFGETFDACAQWLHNRSNVMVWK